MTARAMALAAALGLTFGLNLARLPRLHLPRVSAETAARSPLALEVQAPGTVEPRKEETLKAEFAGEVLSKAYREGDAVRAGQVLLELDRSQIRGAYQAAANAVRNAESDLKKASREVALQNKLLKAGAVARSSVEEAERLLVRAEQAVELSRAALRVEQKRWDGSKVLAPFDGVVLKDALGDQRAATAGQTLLSVADLSSFTVRAHVDELEVGLLKTGQPAELRVASAGGAPLRGRVAKIGAQADAPPATTFPVELSVDAGAGVRLLPKMSAAARIAAGRTEAVLSAPLEAVVTRAGQPHLWVIGAKGRLSLRPVVLGRANLRRVEVVSGLAAGETLCARALPALAAGGQVNLDD